MCATEQVCPTHIKRIILAHLSSELVPNPIFHMRTALRIKPPQPLDLPNDPFPFALFRKNPAKTSIICCSPEGKVEEKESLSCVPGQKEENDQLQSQKSKIEQVQMALGVTRMEECRQDIMSGWNAKDWQQQN